MKGSYRKYNDRTMNSSTYHKKDGTSIRSLLKKEVMKEIEEYNDHCKIYPSKREWLSRVHM